MVNQKPATAKHETRGRTFYADFHSQMFYNPGRIGHIGAVRPLLGDSLTVERAALTRLVLVRIQVPQPAFPIEYFEIFKTRTYAGANRVVAKNRRCARDPPNQMNVEPQR